MNDGELQFSKKQNLPATGTSDNVLDVGRDIGAGTPIYLEIDSPPASGTGTLTAQVEHDDSAAMGAATVHVSYLIPNDRLLKGGAILSAALPPGNKKFLRLKYLIGGTVTGMVVTAGLTTSPQSA